MNELDEKQVSRFIKKYTRKQKSTDINNSGYFVWLDIDQQHFKLADPKETKKQANWYRRQLAIALIRLASASIEEIMNEFEIEVSLLSKLGSIVIHAEELLSDGGHKFDKAALESLISDQEIQKWLSKMNAMALLPVKR